MTRPCSTSVTVVSSARTWTWRGSERSFCAMLAVAAAPFSTVARLTRIFPSATRGWARSSATRYCRSTRSLRMTCA
jgi:hypothetical protein